MKILQIISHYVPAYEFGGPLRVAHSLSKSLINLGHEVTICTSNLKNGNEDLEVLINKPIMVDGAKVFYLKVEKNRYWGYSSGFKNRLIKEIDKADVVLTHFHYQYSSYIGGLLTRKAKKPLIVFSHGSLNKKGIHKRNTFLKYFYIKFFEKSNFNYSSFIAFNCEEELQLSYFKSKGKVIPNGIEPNDFIRISKSPINGLDGEKLNNKIIFLYLGRLNYAQKGLDILLPAFHKVTLSNSKAHLIIAVPDERGGYELVKKYIIKHKLENRITVTGMLDDIQKLTILNLSDVFILPSPSEGLSIALLEALYMKLPVITTRGVGLHKKIIEKNAGIIIDYDEEQLFSAIKKLIDKKSISKIKGNGKSFVELDFTWSKIGEQFSKLLCELVKPETSY